jgi:predicted DNA-binding transcriptional regulator AlpA
MSPERLVTLDELAEMTKTNVDHLRRVIRAGRGPKVIRFGGTGAYRFHPRDIAEWLERETRTAA